MAGMRSQRASEGGGSPHGRQARELTPQRFDLECPIQAQQTPEIVRRVFLQPLRALDAQERHQQEGDPRRAQPVEGGPEAPVDVPGEGEDATVHEGRQGAQHAGAASSRRPR